MASAMTTKMIFIGITANLLTSTHANEFLKPAHKDANEWVSEADIRASLLTEIEGALGVGSTSRRADEMEKLLQPIFTSLPKNEFGNLGHATVRYALHRVFVLRHGWLIKGLDPSDSSWESSSPAGILTDQVPAYIQHMFEDRLDGKGFRLQEAAVLAATIEHLIHTEAVSRLGDAFKVHEHTPASMLTQSETSEVLDTYMMGYILGENLTNMTRTEANELLPDMSEVFKTWVQTQEFVRAQQKNITEGKELLDFSTVANVAEAVGEQFGTFQDRECQQLKAALVAKEYLGTGRVKMSEFYATSTDTAWQFQESSAYLRQLGVLDESDPAEPSVMIANYIGSASNCIAASGFYSVCCKDECAGLLGHLEQRLATPAAKPADIVRLISKLPSSTITSPYLSVTLLERLDDIAASHAGHVPLHSRLFAQWMHHVYPRECPFPHMSGSTTSLTPDEWEDDIGSESVATEEEIMQFMNATSIASNRNMDIPWSSEDELLIPPSSGLWSSSSSSQAFVRGMMLLTASCSLAFGMIQSLKVELRSAGSGVQKLH
jgi:hypothetical protein